MRENRGTVARCVGSIRFEKMPFRDHRMNSNAVYLCRLYALVVPPHLTHPGTRTCDSSLSRRSIFNFPENLFSKTPKVATGGGWLIFDIPLSECAVVFKLPLRHCTYPYKGCTLLTHTPRAYSEN